ncbi:hypothetical protein LguiB_020363 [Lonicera macranthoides]
MASPGTSFVVTSVQRSSVLPVLNPTPMLASRDKLHKDRIMQVETGHRRMLLSLASYNMPNMFNIFLRVGKILFRKKWKEFMEIRKEQERMLRPLIESRISEFFNARTDIMSTILQWILANMVKYPEIQSKHYEEIAGVMDPASPPRRQRSGEEIGIRLRVVKEEDEQKMPNLKAAVLEGLKRHPPSHFVMPHSVSEDVELEVYVMPKNATINFMVADFGWNPKVWKNPMEFKPKRFIIMNKDDDVFDITRNKEITMMPFGARMRICLSLDLSILHLEYFVANLVWYYEWKDVEGEEVDLLDKLEFTFVMSNLLKAHISPRGTLNAVGVHLMKVRGVHHVLQSRWHSPILFLTARVVRSGLAYLSNPVDSLNTEVFDPILRLAVIPRALWKFSSVSLVDFIEHIPYFAPTTSLHTLAFLMDHFTSHGQNLEIPPNTE